MISVILAFGILILKTQCPCTPAAAAASNDDTPCSFPQVHFGSSGQLRSHARFGLSDYPANMDCVYQIQVPTDQEIDIQILDIDIEETNECMFDFVSVGELNSSFPYRFCGSQKPKFPIRVRNSVARVHFVSDSGQGGRGFLMAFQSVLSNKNDADKRACGVAPQVNDQNATRILGGFSVVSGQWPWMASLWYDRRFVCGASLVASQWLLTAAHCLPLRKEIDRWNAVLGDLLLDWPDSGEQIVRMTKVKIHPMYNVGARYDYDLALIKLAEEAQLGPSVRPICLLRGEKLLSTLTTLEFTNGCYVAGWGRSETQAVTNELRHLRMPLLNVTACNETEAYRGLLTSSMLCAGHSSGGHDSCKGDSGGPLMCQIGSTGTWYQIGVVSFGKQCALMNTPGIYSNVRAAVSWIESILKSDEL